MNTVTAWNPADDYLVYVEGKLVEGFDTLPEAESFARAVDAFERCHWQIRHRGSVVATN